VEKTAMGALIESIHSKHVGCFLCLLNRTHCYVWIRRKNLWPFVFEMHLMETQDCSDVCRKFSWGFHSVVYSGHLYLVSAICDVTIWHHVYVSKPTFWRSFL